MKKILATLISLAFCGTIYAQTWHKIGFTSLTTDGGFEPTIAFDSSGNLYASFVNFWDSKASAIKYNGSVWSIVGSTGFSAGDPAPCATGIPLAIAPNGTPYVAYPDTNAMVTVKKYDGTNWVTVGMPCFSSATVVGIAIALDSIGTPYVVFNCTDSLAPGATVMKFNGTNWVLVGSAGFSGGYANTPTIAIGIGGTPYVVYGDYLMGGNASVKKFNGSSWVNVGSPDFSSGFALYTSIAIDKHGTPYVVYQDQGTVSDGATVMKFNGTNWVNVGTVGFSAGAVNYTNIAIDTNGTPYVSYADIANGEKATVMKFDGSSWNPVGTAGFSAGMINFNSLALDKYGIPYLSYTDTGSGNAVVMKFSTATEVENKNTISKNSISIIPNPNHGSFVLNISSIRKEDATIIITNLAGEKVSEIKGTTNIAIPINLSVQSGIYLVTTITSSGEQSEPFMVW